jgi:hypothetical protein
MTFLEAAIELLRQAGRPLSIQDLTQRAIEQRLLTNAGRTPELTMQARLAQELRKGSNTLLVQNDKEFGLTRYDKPRLAAGEVAPGPVVKEAKEPKEPKEAKEPRAPREPKPAPAPRAAVPAVAVVEAEVEAVEGAADAIMASDADADVAAEAEAGEGATLDAEGEAGDDAAKKKRRRRGGRGRGGKKKADAAAPAAEAPVAVTAEPAPAAAEVAPESTPEDGTPEEALMAERLAEESERAEQAAAAATARRHVADAARRAEVARAAAREADLADEAEEAAQAAADQAAYGHHDQPAAVLYTPPGDDEPAVDLDGILAPSRRRRGIIDLPDEAALAAEYSDELVSGGTTATAPVEGELIDAQTADEDRPMLDEIQADDRGRGRHRRGAKGKDRRGGKGRERGGRTGREAPAGREPHAHAHAAAPPREGREARPARENPPRGEARPGQPREPHQREGSDLHEAAAANGVAAGASVAPVASVGASAEGAPAPGGARQTLADIGYQLLRSINDGRPVHARQLAAMALKRRMITAGDPEDLWRAFRVALLDDARARVSRGLRPRVRHQGSGNFAIVLTRLEPDLQNLEEQVVQRAETLARETRLALRRRLSKLPLPALENLARLLLERLGYTDIERVKRVEATGYLTARVKHGAIPQRVLIGVRSGAEEAGRRAVGELRAGVSAKQLDAGLLLCVTRCGPEAERESRQPGPPCTVYDGDAFSEALIAAGVGVLRVSLPITYLDPEFFADLTDSLQS